MVPPSYRFAHPFSTINSHTFLPHEFIQALVQDREPSLDVYTAVAETACGMVAHESALRDGELMKIPSFDKQV